MLILIYTINNTMDLKIGIKQSYRDKHCSGRKNIILIVKKTNCKVFVNFILSLSKR